MRGRGTYGATFSSSDPIRRTLWRHGHRNPMPPITALLQTMNDALRLGRTLETLLPCREFLILDHHSADATRRIARDYGARIVDANNQAAVSHYLDLARCDWILCLGPGEAITESLQATLFEWSALPSERVADSPAFSVFVREQTAETWLERPAPETRLIPRRWPQWHGRFPAPDPSAGTLEGELLHFTFP